MTATSTDTASSMRKLAVAHLLAACILMSVQLHDAATQVEKIVLGAQYGYLCTCLVQPSLT